MPTPHPAQPEFAKPFTLPLATQGVTAPVANTHTSEQAPEPLSLSVQNSVQAYLEGIRGSEINDLYQTVLAEVERPLLEIVLKNTDSNQSKAAKMLGLSRSTLRKKLKIYHLI